MATTTSAGRQARAVHFGWVSLFQDLGSKMVVPVVPLFLVSALGASPLAVGLIEGSGALAVAVAAAATRRRSDRQPHRWVRIGYGLSSAMKLALAVAASWPAVLAIRAADRAGKGIRDTPRDLLLAETPKARHGRTFGIQQTMDKAGGAAGPLVGLAIYRLFDSSFDAVFVAATLPCMVSVALLWRIPPVKDSMGAASEDVDRQSPAGDTPTTGTTAAQRRALLANVVHSIGFVPASLILVRAVEVEATVASALVAFAGLRVVTAAVSYPAGWLVDRRGAGQTVVLGMTAAATAMLVAAAATTTTVVWIALLLTGVAEALTKGPTRAWLVSLGPATSRGSVLAARASSQSVATFASATLAGLVWGSDGRLAFAVAAGVAALGAFLAPTTDRQHSFGSGS